MTPDEQFFFDHATSTASPDEDREDLARQLVVAEDWVGREVYSFEWDLDPDCEYGGLDPHDFAGCWVLKLQAYDGTTEHTLEGVLEPLAPTYDWRRVIEAEMALDSMLHGVADEDDLALLEPVPRGPSRPGARLSPEAARALDELNAHRRALLMPPLDPAAAGWTPEDVILEAERLRRNPRAVRQSLLGW